MLACTQLVEEEEEADRLLQKQAPSTTRLRSKKNISSKRFCLNCLDVPTCVITFPLGIFFHPIFANIGKEEKYFFLSPFGFPADWTA